MNFHDKSFMPRHPALLALLTSPAAAGLLAADAEFAVAIGGAGISLCVTWLPWSLLRAEIWLPFAWLECGRALSYDKWGVHVEMVIATACTAFPSVSL